MQTTMKINLRKVHENATLPTYAKEGDACMDITAVDYNMTDKYVEYDSGIAIEIPEGYVGIMRPRSSVSGYDLLWKTSGVIDSGYRGTLKGRFQIVEGEEKRKMYKVGERFAQLMIIPYPSIEFVEVQELSETERGEGGFGHTGS